MVCRGEESPYKEEKVPGKESFLKEKQSKMIRPTSIMSTSAIQDNQTSSSLQRSSDKKNKSPSTTFSASPSYQTSSSLSSQKNTQNTSSKTSSKTLGKASFSSDQFFSFSPSDTSLKNKKSHEKQRGRRVTSQKEEPSSSLNPQKLANNSFAPDSFLFKKNIFSTNLLPEDFSLVTFKKLLQSKNYKKASLYVNQCLRKNLKNASLHTVNGLVYEEMAKVYQQNHYLGCAKAAYLTAHRLDPYRWFPLYSLGLLEYNNGEYEEAVEHFWKAFALHPKHKETGLMLTQAAYGAKDLNLAYDNAQKLMDIFPHCPRVLRHGIILYAVGGEFANAFIALEKYKKLPDITEENVEDICEKIQQWRIAHRLAFTQRSMAKGPYSIKNPPEAPKEKKEENPDEHKEEEKKKDSDLVKNPIVVFEGYIIALVDTDVLNIGNNILNPVSQENQLQDLGFLFGFDRNLGSTYENVINAPEFSGGDITPQNTKTINNDSKMSFNVGAMQEGGKSTDIINYSLNLLNSQNECLMISARPSVSALLGQKVTFSDFNRVSGMVGGSNITVEAGVKVEFKPLKIKDNHVLLFISSTHSYLNPGYNLGKSLEDQIIAVRKVVSATTTEIKSGESILLSGYSRDIDQALVRGLPGAQNIPFVNLFFSRREKLKDRRRVLFLIRVYIANDEPLKPKEYKKDRYFGTSRPVLDRVLEFFESREMSNTSPSRPFVNYALIDDMPSPNKVKNKEDFFQKLDFALQGV